MFTPEKGLLVHAVIANTFPYRSHSSQPFGVLPLDLLADRIKADTVEQLTNGEGARLRVAALAQSGGAPRPGDDAAWDDDNSRSAVPRPRRASAAPDTSKRRGSGW